METDDRKKEIAQYIGKNILELRKSMKLSREQFAEQTNLSPNFIYEVESGNSIPGGVAIIDICNFCKVAPSNILGKYLDTNIYTASELINTNYQTLSEYDKKLIIDMINLLANR